MAAAAERAGARVCAPAAGSAHAAAPGCRACLATPDRVWSVSRTPRPLDWRRTPAWTAGLALCAPPARSQPACVPPLPSAPSATHTKRSPRLEAAGAAALGAAAMLNHAPRRGLLLCDLGVARGQASTPQRYSFDERLLLVLGGALQKPGGIAAQPAKPRRGSRPGDRCAHVCARGFRDRLGCRSRVCAAPLGRYAGAGGAGRLPLRPAACCHRPAAARQRPGPVHAPMHHAQSIELTNLQTTSVGLGVPGPRVMGRGVQVGARPGAVA